MEIINKLGNVSIPTIIGETADMKKKKKKKTTKKKKKRTQLFAKVTRQQHAPLQRCSHHILKCRGKSVVIHRLNHMNKRSKGENG